MLAKVFSGAVFGLEGVLVEVEVEVVERGLPSFKIVGLPGKAVEEAKERVRAAILNSGAQFPKHRITVNLAPADLPKNGPAFDLPIALGTLIASGQLPQKKLRDLVVGELSLDGTVRPIQGGLALAHLARKEGLENLYIGAANKTEVGLVTGLRTYPVENLKKLVVHFSGLDQIIPYSRKIDFGNEPAEAEFDFADIKGQEQAKRAAEIAAAGGHNLFLKGLPGSGKTMLARALPGILPPLEAQEVLELTKIYSVAGLLDSGEGVVYCRPFRAPHHSVSNVGMIGGGSYPQPGEVTLAHRGVLFLDELPEFPRGVIESLRQPLEDGRVAISRAAGRVVFPARFMLVAASNPCPCGWLGSQQKNCHCPPAQIIRYQRKLSGPILDRIDLHVDVDLVPVDKLTSTSLVAESSLSIRKRVVAARCRQNKRFEKIAGKYTNSQLNSRELKKYCSLSDSCLGLLRQAVSELGLTARGYYKVIRVGRTIADLAGAELIDAKHLAEALQYRPRESLFGV